MKITLVRHAQTEQNYLGNIQGHANYELNDEGIRECLKLKAKLKDQHFDVCYMSPLIRTVQTAMIVVGERVLTIPDKRLIERDMGELEGTSADLYDHDKFWDYDLNFTDFGVEKIQDVFARCREFLDYVYEHNAGKDIIIVSHAVPIRALRHLLLNTDLSHTNLRDISIGNCYCETFEIKKEMLD